MLQVNVPGWGEVNLEHAVFDVNGTLAVDGRLIKGVAAGLARLRMQLTIHMITADTHGAQAEIDRVLGLSAHRMKPGNEREQKAQFVERLGAPTVVAIGNGANDVGMLKAAALSIAVLGREGLSGEAALVAHVLVADVLDALGLLLVPKRLVATLRR